GQQTVQRAARNSRLNQSRGSIAVMHAQQESKPTGHDYAKLYSIQTMRKSLKRCENARTLTRKGVGSGKALMNRPDIRVWASASPCAKGVRKSISCTGSCLKPNWAALSKTCILTTRVQIMAA